MICVIASTFLVYLIERLSMVINKKFHEYSINFLRKKRARQLKNLSFDNLLNTVTWCLVWHVIWYKKKMRDLKWNKKRKIGFSLHTHTHPGYWEIFTLSILYFFSSLLRKTLKALMSMCARVFVPCLSTTRLMYSHFFE